MSTNNTGPAGGQKPEMSKAQMLLVRIAKQKEEVAALKELWATLFPEIEVPEDRQFIVWLNRYDFYSVSEGLEATLVWFNKCQQAYEETHDEACTRSRLDFIKYASATMSRIYNTED